MPCANYHQREEKISGCLRQGTLRLINPETTYIWKEASTNNCYIWWCYNWCESDRSHQAKVFLWETAAWLQTQTPFLHRLSLQFRIRESQASINLPLPGPDNCITCTFHIRCSQVYPFGSNPLAAPQSQIPSSQIRLPKAACSLRILLRTKPEDRLRQHREK